MIIIIINDDVTLQELSSALSSSCLHQPAVSVNLIITTIIIMVTQHIPTSQIPTRWESDIMIKGGNLTQSNSHHTNIQMFQETIDNSAH